MLTGGIPPDITQSCSADAVYRSLYRRVMLQNQRYYQRFPADIRLMQRIVLYLEAQPGGGALLPSGSRLTPRTLQLLGLGGEANLHTCPTPAYSRRPGHLPHFSRSSKH